MLILAGDERENSASDVFLWRGFRFDYARQRVRRRLEKYLPANIDLSLEFVLDRAESENYGEEKDQGFKIKN